MMRSIICAVLIVGVVIAGLSLALGQEPYRNDPQYNEPYSDMEPDGDEGLLIRPVDCGEYRYWKSGRCVDARMVPPTSLAKVLSFKPKAAIAEQKQGKDHFPNKLGK